MKKIDGNKFLRKEKLIEYPSVRVEMILTLHKKFVNCTLINFCEVLQILLILAFTFLIFFVAFLSLFLY